MPVPDLPDVVLWSIPAFIVLTVLEAILIVWDRLFGSFAPEVDRPVYGLTKNITTYNPLRVAVHEYAAIGRDVRAATTWRERALSVFASPGWALTRSTDRQSS